MFGCGGIDGEKKINAGAVICIRKDALHIYQLSTTGISGLALLEGLPGEGLDIQRSEFKYD